MLNVSIVCIKSSKLHLHNFDKILKITRRLQNCTTTDSCLLHLSQTSASLFLPCSSLNFLEILFKNSSAIRPKKLKCSKSNGIHGVVDSDIWIGLLLPIFWQLIVGCCKNVGEPLKYPSLLWNIQWDHMLLYLVGSLI